MAPTENYLSSPKCYGEGLAGEPGDWLTIYIVCNFIFNLLKIAVNVDMFTMIKDEKHLNDKFE